MTIDVSTAGQTITFGTGADITTTGSAAAGASGVDGGDGGLVTLNTNNALVL